MLAVRAAPVRALLEASNVTVPEVLGLPLTVTVPVTLASAVDDSTEGVPSRPPLSTAIVKHAWLPRMIQKGKGRDARRVLVPHAERPAVAPNRGRGEGAGRRPRRG